MFAGTQKQPLPRGTTLNAGRYRIDHELNRGGTAVVYAAEDLHTHKQVALKVMNGPDQVPIKIVKREITFSSSMQHENIVRLLDVFAEKQQLVIVWELIIGPDMLDLLNESGGRMPEDMAAYYFVQLLKAVLFMHKNGFCHRDIKPENCMVERKAYQLKLIDFGLSKHIESAQTLGVGTPDYMSPEMLSHHGPFPNRAAAAGGGFGSPAGAPYDARAVDAWAMGVLMYLLVTGKYPFEEPSRPNNLAATIQNVLLGRMRTLPDSISHGCVDLIKSLLRTKPEQRRTLMDLCHDPWLSKAALAYATKVGRPDLVSLQGYVNIQLPSLSSAPGGSNASSFGLVSADSLEAARELLPPATASTKHGLAPLQEHSAIGESTPMLAIPQQKPSVVPPAVPPPVSTAPIPAVAAREDSALLPPAAVPAGGNTNSSNRSSSDMDIDERKGPSTAIPSGNPGARSDGGGGSSGALSRVCGYLRSKLAVSNSPGKY